MPYKPDYKYKVIQINHPIIIKDGKRFEKIEDIWYNSYHDEISYYIYDSLTKLIDFLNSFAMEHDIVDILRIQDNRIKSGRIMNDHTYDDFNYVCDYTGGSLNDDDYIFYFNVKDKIEDIDIINRLEKELSNAIDKEVKKDKKDKEKLYFKLKKELGY